MDSELKSQKMALRSKMRTRLASLSSEQKNAASAALCQQLASYLRDHPHIRTVATFAALPSEPDLQALHSLAPEITLVYPKSQKEGSMQFFRVDSYDDLKTGLYNIPEPLADPATAVPLDHIDLILCPAFAYTLDGQRLGKGGGYYDRALTHQRENSTLLGVIFRTQLLDQIPTESHDISVDHVLYA